MAATARRHRARRHARRGHPVPVRKLSPDATTKSLGFAFAFGIAVDAFVIRMTIVPAVLALLGDRAWSLPRWLDHVLPELDVEGSELRVDDVEPERELVHT